jgi:hypothetical protein
MIGNPVFSCQDGFIGSDGYYYVEIVNLLYWHGFTSYSNYFNWTSSGCNDHKMAQEPKCQWIFNNIQAQVGKIFQEKRNINFNAPPPPPPITAWPSLDPDAIFQDFCLGNATLAFADSPNAQGSCPDELGTLLHNYLNRADVQNALKVQGKIVWNQCSTTLKYSIAGNSMIPYYENFFVNKPGFKILVYSGDQDILTVPFAFTQPCIAQLSGKLVTEWQPWFVNGATAGYVEQYDKYTYATIKGAGHEAPLYQPLLSFQMIQRFLTNGVLFDKGDVPFRRSNQGVRQSDILRKYNVRV